MGKISFLEPQGAEHIHGKLDDELAFEGEHYQSGEEQGKGCDRADFGNESFFVPLSAFCLDADQTRKYAHNEGNAKIDEDTLGNLTRGNVDRCAGQADPIREKGDKERSIHGKNST